MTLAIYTELKQEIEIRLNEADNLVKSFEKGPLGLVPITTEFKEAKRMFDKVFNELRKLNQRTPNSIKREYSMKRRFEK